MYPAYLLVLLALITPILTTTTTTTTTSKTTKPRVFILSDILNEPDDTQSLIRYLLYANEFQTEGLVAVTSTWLPNSTHPEAIHQIIDAYAAVHDNLTRHAPPWSKYPSPSALHRLVSTGPAVYGMQALHHHNSTRNNNTTSSTPLSPGAKALLRALHASTTTAPLHIPVWGGTNTLAQALQHLSTTQPPAHAAAVRARLRVYAISDQDDTGAWIRTVFPDVFFVVSRHAWRAYRAAAWPGISAAGLSALADDGVVSADWLRRNIQRRGGVLGGVYPDTENIMEGDTPSWLGLVPNGLGDWEEPAWGGWGGRYAAETVTGGVGERQFGDTLDTVYGRDGMVQTSSQAGIWRWRSAFQNDFAARMGWAGSGRYGDARHAPVVRVNGHEGVEALVVRARLNQSLVFDAGETVDVDGDADGLRFEWFQYLEASYLPAPASPDSERLRIRPAGDGEVVEYNEQGFKDVVRAKKVRVTLPAAQSVPVQLGYHLVVQVSTGGEFPMTRYKRVVLRA